MSRIEREDIIAVVLCLAYFVLLYNYVNLQAPTRVPFSPDENGVLSTSKMLVESGTVFWKSLLNERYGVEFFRPRQFIEVRPNIYVTLNSVGFAMLLALARVLHILPIIVPSLAVVGVLATYGAVAEVFDKKAGPFVAAAFGAVPTFVFFSNAYFDIVPSVSFFLLSLWAFMKYLRMLRTWQVAACSLFLAVSIFLRPYSVLFLIGYAAVIIVNRKQLASRSLAISVLCFSLSLVPTFMINEYSYGGAFSVGVAHIAGLPELVMSQRIGPEAYWVAFLHYVVGLAPLLFVLGMFGAAVALRHARALHKNPLLVHLGAVSFSSFLAFGALTRSWGFYEVTPVASVARYMMPVYLLLACGAYVFVRELLSLRMKRISGLVVSVLLVSLVAGSFASNALPSLVAFEHAYSGVESVVSDLPDNSVIFTRTFDKLIFPTRNVALVYTSSDLSQNPDLRFILPILDIDRDVVPVVRQLLRDGFHVYLARDVDDLADHLARQGYIITPAGTTLRLREVSSSLE